MASKGLLSTGAYAGFEPIIPTDHAKQVTAYYYVEHRIDAHTIHKVLDLGCGDGSSREYFRRKLPDSRWVGLDLANSPEVSRRLRTGGEFLVFDGLHMPLPDASFEMIFSQQVFEHARHPRELLTEVERVLKPGGYFIGSVSQMEPYHSYSLWNYTIYGFQSLIAETTLHLCEIRPGPDVLALVVRKCLGCPNVCNIFWKVQTPLHGVIQVAGCLCRMETRTINLLKLLVAGQFAFLVQKPAS